MFKSFLCGLFAFVLIFSINVNGATDGNEYKGTQSSFLLMNGETNISFSHSNGRDMCKAKSIFGQEIITDNFSNIAEPTYDQTFKALFTGDVEIGGFTPTQRLINLLNSILYPEADDNKDVLQIRRITPLNSEITQIAMSDSSGVLRFDIACKCECWEEERSKQSTPSRFKALDLEMQKSYECGFDERAYHYGAGLNRKYNLEVEILAFLNGDKRPNQNDSFRIMPYKVSHIDGTPIQKIECVSNIANIDLNFCSDMILQNKKIFINEKEIGKVGREWLKFFSIVQWESPVGGSKYVVLTDGITPEIASAIVVLSQFNDASLMDLENGRRAELGMIKGGALQQAKRTCVVLIGMGMDNESISKATGLSNSDINSLRASNH